MNENLVSEIKEEELRELGQRVCDEYDTDIESRSEWEEKRDRWYRLWACFREKKNDPWEGASNVCIPMLATASNQFHARAYQSIFAPPGMVKAIPVSDNDFQRAKNVEKYMNWQTLYEMVEYEEEFDKLLQLLPINGTAFKKTIYDAKEGRNVSEHIPVLDLVLPFKTKSMKTARRITHRVWLHYDEIEDRIREGIYENADKIQEEPDTVDDSSLQNSAIDVSGEDSEKKTESPHLFLERHQRLEINGKRSKYILTVHYDTNSVVRVIENNFDGKEIEFFTDYHFIPNPEGFYSLGFGHFLEQLNEMANTTFNQIFDSGRLTNQPFGFYGRRAGIKTKKIKLTPGSMTAVEDATQVYFPSMQRVDQTLFMVLGLIQQYMEQFTSTSDYLSGRESKGTKTPTAHGTLAIIEQGLVTFAVMTKRIFRSLRKELKTIMLLNSIFLPPEKQYRIMGTDDNIAFKDIKKDDFAGVYDVIPIGDPSYASKATRRGEAQEVYQMAMTNPLIVGNPELGMKPNVRAMWEVTSDFLDSYDKKNKSKILPELPEEPLAPEMENAKFMQGDITDPKPGENHRAHIASHFAFLDGPYGGQLSPDNRNLIIDHIKKTEQIMYIESQQVRALGGVGGQG